MPAATGANAAAYGSFATAEDLTAMGRDEASAQLLRALLARSGLGNEGGVRELLMLNERSLFRYRAALNTIAPLLGSAGDPALANKARLLAALRDAPPQTLDSPPALALRGFIIPARVGVEMLPVLLDTGASFSAIPRAAAARAHLYVRRADYRIATALGGHATADVAVGNIELASVQVRNVVFLVLPDSAFAAGQSFAAVIGIPVLRQLRVTIGADNRSRKRAGIAVPIRLADGLPMVRASLERGLLSCQINTGADRSSIDWPSRLPAPASQPVRYVSVLGASGKPLLVRGRRLPLKIRIADRNISLPRAFLLSGGRRSNSACSLGRDAIERLAPLTMDFRTMRLILE